MECFTSVLTVCRYKMCVCACIMFCISFRSDPQGMDPLYGILRAKPEVFHNKDPNPVFMS